MWGPSFEAVSLSQGSSFLWAPGSVGQKGPSCHQNTAMDSLQCEPLGDAFQPPESPVGAGTIGWSLRL